MVGEGSIVVLESDGVISLNVTIDREIEEQVMCEVITQPGTAKGGFLPSGPGPAWWMYIYYKSCVKSLYIISKLVH